MFNTSAILRLVSLAAACAALTLTSAAQAAVDRVWDGSAGDGLWSNPNNWDPNDTNAPAFVPDTYGASGEVSIINDVITSDRTITTPGALTRVETFDWEYAAGSTGVDKIVLGGEFRVMGHSQTNATKLSRNRAGCKGLGDQDASGFGEQVVGLGSSLDGAGLDTSGAGRVDHQRRQSVVGVVMDQPA